MLGQQLEKADPVAIGQLLFLGVEATVALSHAQVNLIQHYGLTI